MLVHLPLRAHRNILAGGHGEGSRQQTGDTGEQDGAVVRRRTCHAENEACVRHQAVVDAEHGGAQISAACNAVMALADLSGRSRRRVSGCGVAVYGEPPHFHRGEDAAHRTRAVATHQSRHEAGAQIGNEGGHRREPRVLRPDRGLPLGLARELPEQLRARRAAFDLRDHAVEVRRAGLVDPSLGLCLAHFGEPGSRWNRCRNRCTTGANTTPAMTMTARPL